MTPPMPRSDADGLLTAAVDELRDVLVSGAAVETERLCDELQAARRIACYGVGREGLMMRALCMRLMHLGLDAHVVGDMTTPPVGMGDLLVVSAGPGAFSTVLALLGVAHSAGARTVVITAETAPNFDSGAAAWSPDEGRTWHRLHKVSGYWGLAFASPKAGWFVGNNGQILKISF